MQLFPWFILWIFVILFTQAMLLKIALANQQLGLESPETMTLPRPNDKDDTIFFSKSRLRISSRFEDTVKVIKIAVGCYANATKHSGIATWISGICTIITYALD